MGWTIPDKGEGDSDIQARCFQEYLEVLVEGVSGLNCVLSGLVVTGGADMTPAVAKGSVLSAGIMYAVAAADVTVTAADGSNPRLDLIVVTSAGALAVRAGTAAAAPKPPARTANDVVIAVVYIPASDTTIATSQIKDLRMLRERGPICIYKTTTAETTNTTAAAIDILNKAASGLVIPNGLFLAGRQLQIRIVGNYLFNSGTPTLTLTIIYGATTMFADVTVASLADADRGAWHIDMLLTAQANNDQSVGGVLTLVPIEVARALPTTGQAGDLAFANTSNRLGPANFAGAAAIDSDAANSTLRVQFTMNVSNVANEIVVEGAYVNLI